MNAKTREHPENTRLVCRADIQLDALTHNLNLLREQAHGAEIVAMVKANAYGHGASIVARHLESQGVKWFGVSTVDEGIDLRRTGIKARILVMSGAGAQFFGPDLVEHQLTPLLSSMAELDKLVSAVGHPCRTPLAVHLDLDTGMCRGGFFNLDVASLTGLAKSIVIEGVSSHFAKAEQSECEFTKMQVARFFELVEEIKSSGHSPSVLHIDKSASILTRDVSHFAGAQILVRPGLALYGVDPTKEQRFEARLRPVLSWRAPIVLRKSLPEGTPIGYDCTFLTQRPSEIALVRVGYGDGLNRRLSNLGHMIVGETRAPIVGRISMDLSVIDVTDAVAQNGFAACEVGRFAHIIGGEHTVVQSAAEIAKLCGTIPYEVLTWISGRVERYPI